MEKNMKLISWNKPKIYFVLLSSLSVWTIVLDRCAFYVHTTKNGYEEKIKNKDMKKTNSLVREKTSRRSSTVFFVIYLFNLFLVLLSTLSLLVMLMLLFVLFILYTFCRILDAVYMRRIFCVVKSRKEQIFEDKSIKWNSRKSAGWELWEKLFRSFQFQIFLSRHILKVKMKIIRNNCIKVH